MNTQVFTKKKKILMSALDHRGSFRKLINPKNPDKAKTSAIINLKEKIITALFDQFSGLLIDPQYGLPAYKNFLKKTGKPKKPFLLCVEKTGSKQENGEKISELQYRVPYLKSLGAGGVKLLLYFNPFAKSRSQQLQTAKKVLQEAQKENLPFFLEVVTYQLPGENKKTADLLLPSLKMFLKENIIPDVFKLEYPGNPQACQEITRLLGNTPWVLLTRGKDFKVFKEELETAVAAGASGFLAGRALWQEVVNYQGEKQEKFLKQTVTQRFQEISEIVLKQR